MDKCILPGVNKKVGRPGMAMWSILVLAVVKQGLGYDFDRLHDTVNQHMTLRQFPGHTDSDKKRYHYQTLVDNMSLLTPERLGKVDQLIVESGHTVVGKKPGEPLLGRCDSFVVETNVHYPTDVNLLLDAILCMLRHAGPLGSKHKVPDWASGCICWKPSRINSTRFGKPDAPDERISRSILNSALNLSAALKHSFRNWPHRKGGFTPED